MEMLMSPRDEIVVHVSVDLVVSVELTEDITMPGLSLYTTLPFLTNMLFLSSYTEERLYDTSGGSYEA